MKSKKIECDSCSLMMIQGVVCHESGCPNMPIAVCGGCHEPITRSGGIWHANDWDGIEYCKPCAEDACQWEQEWEQEQEQGWSDDDSSTKE